MNVDEVSRFVERWKKRYQHETGAVILSGGMDSTALTYLLNASGSKLKAISFNYGQKHSKELEYAHSTCDDLNIPHDVIDVSFLGGLLKSALTTEGHDVPEGHYADENMKQTVVPNRNMIMLSIAAGICVAEGGSYVATGVHAGDHAIYPDCRPEFINCVSTAARVGTEGFARADFHISAPFVNVTKTDIVRIGDLLDVPWEYTWSCYNGRDFHCGVCGTCVERKEAFSDAGVEDPTAYEGEGVR